MDKATNEKVNIIALCVALIGIVVSIIIGAVNMMSYNTDYAALAKQYDDLQLELDTIVDKSVAVDEAQVILNSAKEKGMAVAAIQTQLGADSKLVGTDQEGVFVEEANSLSDYFIGAKACFPWYTTLNDINYSWEFNTMYSFTSTTAPVLWTCYGTVLDDNGQVTDKILLAYATGTYIVEDDLFTNVTVEITSLGRANQEDVTFDYANLTEVLDGDATFYIDEDGNAVIQKSESSHTKKSTTTEGDN